MCCLKDKMTECYQVQKTNKKTKQNKNNNNKKNGMRTATPDYSVTENITAKDHLVG